MTLKADPYGRDTSATDSIKHGRIVSGARLIAEAIYRRVTTKRGQLIEDPDYGDDIRELVQLDFDSESAAASMISSRLTAQVEQDDRITNVEVAVSFAQVDGEQTATIDISCDSELGPFDLSVLATELDVSILRIPE